MFIVVNSGNDDKQIDAYLKSVSVKLPTIVDKSRAFEKTMDVGVISTKNIWQVKVIKPDGSMSPSGMDWEATVQQYLPQAKWKVDPKTVPDSLKATWKALEYGEYSKAAGAIKQAMASSNEKVKTAATAMDAALKADLDAIVASAADAEKAGRKFEAYELYTAAARDFKGLPKATEAATNAKRLAADKDLKDEIKAAGLLEQAQKLLASRTRADQRQGESMIDAIIKQYRNTEAGKTASSMKSSVAE